LCECECHNIVVREYSHSICVLLSTLLKCWRRRRRDLGLCFCFYFRRVAILLRRGECDDKWRGGGVVWMRFSFYLFLPCQQAVVLVIYCRRTSPSYLPISLRLARYWQNAAVVTMENDHQLSEVSRVKIARRRAEKKFSCVLP